MMKFLLLLIMATTLIQNAFSASSIGPGITRNYACCSGGGGNVTSEVNSQRTERSGGTYSNFTVRISSNTGDGSTNFRFRKNTANGNQVVTFAATETGIKSDAVNTDSVAVADVVNWQGINSSAAGTINILGLNNAFSASSNTVQHYNFNVVPENTSVNVTTFLTIGGDQTITPIADAEIKMGTPGTFKNMGVRVSSNSLDVTGTAVFTLMKAGVAQTSTISFSSGETGTKEDTTHSDAVSVDDLFAIELETAGASGAIQTTIGWISLETTNTKTDYVACIRRTQTTSQVRYFDFVGNIGAQPTETPTQFPAQFTQVTSNLRCYVSANTWLASARLTLRINTAAGAQSIGIGSLETGWINTTGTDSIVSTDLLDYEFLTLPGSGSIFVTNVVITAGVDSVSGGSTLLLMGCG